MDLLINTRKTLDLPSYVRIYETANLFNNILTAISLCFELWRGN